MNESAKHTLMAKRVEYQNKPLNYEIQIILETKGFNVAELYYDGWDGRRVKALLTEPTAPGTFPALIFAHPFSGDNTTFLPDAISYAEAGFTSLLIEVPFKRERPYSMEMNLKNPTTVRANYIQWIGDIIRGYDFLTQTVVVDPSKLGFVGRNIGASIAGIITAVDERVKVCAFQAGVPRLSHFWKTANHWAVHKRISEIGVDKLRELADEIADMDFIPNVEDSHCKSWFFQFGKGDDWITNKDIELLKNKMPENGDFKYYDDDHKMKSPRVKTELLEWLKKQFGETPIEV